MVAQIDSKYIKMYPMKLASRLISYALFEGRPVTTRGQWVNPLVFAHLHLWKRLPQMRKVEKPVFILGVGRSGTTILGVLLSMHRDVGFLNEPKAIWHMIHPHEDVGGSYESGNTRYRLNEGDVTPEMQRTAHRIYGGYLTATLSRRVVDKYPELSYRVPFVRELFPDAKFIFLVRNGWDTCASIDKWSARHSENERETITDWWGVNRRKWHLMLEQVIEPDPYFKDAIEAIRGFDSQVDMAAVEWMATMREGMKLLKEHGDAVHLIKYEEFVNGPEKALDDLLVFCELPPDERFMKYAKQTLRPAKPHVAFNLHPAILPLFRETLELLGYSGSRK